MKKIYITNAFSINMLTDSSTLRFQRLSVEEVKEALDQYDVTSCVGHLDTAHVFSSVLGHEIPMSRTTVEMDPETALIIGQYSGPRLAEGTMSLPKGATIEWWFVTHRYLLDVGYRLQ